MATLSNKTIRLLCIFAFCLVAASALGAGNPSPKAYYVWVDLVNLREAPNLQGKVLAQLKRGAEVVVDGEKTESLSRVSLQGAEFEGPWIKVKTDEGQTGWVHGAAVREVDLTLKRMAFGFADAAGKRVLADSRQEFDSTMLSIAFGPGIIFVPIIYDRQQESNDQDDGRAWAANFDNMSGSIFRVDRGNMRADQSYLLVRKDFLAERLPLSLRGLQYKACLPDEAARIETAKGWKIAKSWGLAEVAPEYRVYLVLFKPKGREILASLVLIKPNKIVFRDYPTKVGAGWRVDDGGDINPESFEIICAFAGAYGLEIAYTWGAFEGEMAEYLQEGGNAFMLMHEGYRYLSPL